MCPRLTHRSKRYPFRASFLIHSKHTGVLCLADKLLEARIAFGILSSGCSVYFQLDLRNHFACFNECDSHARAHHESSRFSETPRHCHFLSLRAFTLFLGDLLYHNCSHVKRCSSISSTVSFVDSAKVNKQKRIDSNYQLFHARFRHQDPCVFSSPLVVIVLLYSCAPTSHLAPHTTNLSPFHLPPPTLFPHLSPPSGHGLQISDPF